MHVNRSRKSEYCLISGEAAVLLNLMLPSYEVICSFDSCDDLNV